MTLPVPAKTWTISPNNRISFVSLLDTNQHYLFGIKAFLKTNGYAVKGSASAGTGAMDAVDRWTTFADVTPRGANTVTSQAWQVLTDGNGCDILLAFQGSSDHQGRIAFSPGGLYVAAGTPNQQPTATDEVEVIAASTSLVDATATADRVWHGWVSTDKKACRFAIARQSVFVAVFWGVEALVSTVVTSDKLMGVPVTFSPAVWGFQYTPSQMSFSNFLTTNNGRARVIVASVAFNATLLGGVEEFNSSATQWGNVKTELQGAIGYPLYPLSIGSNLSGAQGKLGNLVDWWAGRTSSVTDGDTYALQLISTSGGIAWPWDSSTQPVLL